VNDYFRWVLLSEFRTRFEYILREIRRIAPDAKILIVDIPDYGMTPTGKRTGNPATIQKGIIEYNQALREIARDYSIPVVDIFSSSLLVWNDPTLVAMDWLHPSGIQYTNWVASIYPTAFDVIGSIK
jgi:lysophospholipase L1-like esterase